MGYFRAAEQRRQKLLSLTVLPGLSIGIVLAGGALIASKVWHEGAPALAAKEGITRQVDAPTPLHMATLESLAALSLPPVGELLVGDLEQPRFHAYRVGSAQGIVRLLLEAEPHTLTEHLIISLPSLLLTNLPLKLLPAPMPLAPQPAEETPVASFEWTPTAELTPVEQKQLLITASPQMETLPIPALPVEVPGPPELAAIAQLPPISHPVPAPLSITPHRENWLAPLLPQADWSEDLQVDLFKMKDPEDSTQTIVAMRVALKKATLGFKPHCFHFFLDRACSREKSHLQSMKQALIKSLRNLDEGNNLFTLTLLGRKSPSFSNKPLPICTKNLQLVEEFLDKQLQDAPARSANPLKELVAHFPATNDRCWNTAVFLSSGQRDQENKEQRALLSALRKKSGGQISLYTASAGSSADTVSLELMSQMNGGSLLYSDTYAGFPRKLTKLLSSLTKPVAKGVVHSIAPRGSSERGAGEVHPFHRSLHPIILYQSRPDWIFLRVRGAQQLTLTLQGEGEEGDFLCTKIVDLSQAQPFTAAHKKRMLEAEAQLHYGHFLDDGDLSELRLAQKLLGRLSK